MILYKKVGKYIFPIIIMVLVLISFDSCKKENIYYELSNTKETNYEPQNTEKINFGMPIMIIPDLGMPVLGSFSEIKPIEPPPSFDE